MNRKFKSDMLEAIYDEAVSMYEVGAISEERMRQFGRDCLIQEYTIPLLPATQSAAMNVREKRHRTPF